MPAFNVLNEILTPKLLMLSSYYNVHLDFSGKEKVSKRSVYEEEF